MHLSVVAHDYKPSTQEPEAGGLLRARDKSRLHGKTLSQNSKKPKKRSGDQWPLLGRESTHTFPSSSLMLAKSSHCSQQSSETQIQWCCLPVEIWSRFPSPLKCGLSSSVQNEKGPWTSGTEEEPVCGLCVALEPSLLTINNKLSQGRLTISVMILCDRSYSVC